MNPITPHTGRKTNCDSHCVLNGAEDSHLLYLIEIIFVTLRYKFIQSGVGVTDQHKSQSGEVINKKGPHNTLYSWVWHTVTIDCQLYLQKHKIIIWSHMWLIGSGMPIPAYVYCLPCARLKTDLQLECSQIWVLFLHCAIVYAMC